MRMSPPGAGANQDRKLRLIRKAMSTATEKFGVGGRIKGRNKPRPITLPKIKSLEEKIG